MVLLFFLLLKIRVLGRGFAGSFEHKKRFVTVDFINRDVDLKGTLFLVLPTSSFFDTYGFSLFGSIGLYFWHFERQRRLVYILNF